MFIQQVTFYTDVLLKGHEAEMLVPTIHVLATDRMLHMMQLNYHVKRERFQEYVQIYIYLCCVNSPRRSTFYATDRVLEM